MNEDKRKLFKSIALPVCFVLLMWIVKLAEIAFDVEFYRWGIFPQTLEGLRGILTAPLIHKDFEHLISNTIPILISSIGIMYFYPKTALKVFGMMYIMTGFWTWCFARESYHIGASGLVYGFVFYLFFSGVFRKDTAAMAISMLITFLYGSLVWGILPVVVTVSWESHLMGALAGIFFAYYYRKSGNISPPHVWAEEDEDSISIDYLQAEGGQVVDEAETQPEVINENSDAPVKDHDFDNPPYAVKYYFKPKDQFEN